MLVGVLGGVAAFVLVFWFVGARGVLDALGEARPPIVGAVLLVAAAWLVAWGLSLRTVLGTIAERPTATTAVFVFAGTTFANNVTPFGQAGGEPFSAALISRATDQEYQSGLAAIASVDALHFVPSLGLGLIGIGYLVTRASVGRRLSLAAAAVVGLAVLLPVAGYVGWRNRYRIERGVVRALTPVVRAVGGALPRVPQPGETAIERRVEGFFAAVERVADDRRGLALALGFSALGWLALATSLWLSLLALGVAVPYLVTFVAIPVGDLGALAPLPGGLGGVEALLIAVLAAVSPVSVATIGAAVLLHRVATYWLPTIVGGGVAAVVFAE